MCMKTQALSQVREASVVTHLNMKVHAPSVWYVASVVVPLMLWASVAVPVGMSMLSTYVPFGSNATDVVAVPYQPSYFPNAFNFVAVAAALSTQMAMQVSETYSAVWPSSF